MSKLTDLDATFVRMTSAGGEVIEGATFANAQGVMFDCPKCGSHSILCWSRARGVPDNIEPGPGRWEMSGAGLDDLSLAPSVCLPHACRWHGFVRNGRCVDTNGNDEPKLAV